MCTGIRLTADNGHIVYARTLEFAQDTQSNILMIPKNYAFQGTAPDQNKGLSWQSKFAVVGANAANQIGIIDGLNEKGLAGGLFYFSGYAEYQSVTPADYARTLAPWELLTWILTNFATVQEVRDALATIKVAPVIFADWNIIIPIHAIVHDPLGKSLVIEYVKGKLTLHDNPLGVITNAPTFDWHLTNAQNYINLTAHNLATVTIDSVALNALGQGSGMLGIPGDFTSPSRFIRALAFSQSVAGLTDEGAARDAAFHLLNLFDITKGMVRDVEDKNILYEYTQWTSAMDLHNKRYYFHTYDNRQIYYVDLNNLNTASKEPLIIPMQHPAKMLQLSREHKIR